MTPSNVWYIPGLNSECAPQFEAEAALHGIFPGSEVYIKCWEPDNLFSDIIARTLFPIPLDMRKRILSSLLRWNNSLKETDNTAQKLCQKIVEMPACVRDRLIIVGHSLGGNITIKTLALLAERKLKIHQAILLGAAIANDDFRINHALKGSFLPIYSVINRRDMVLNDIFPISTNSSALGTGIAIPVNLDEYLEIMATPSYVHDSSYYLGQLAKFFRNIAQRRL